MFHASQELAFYQNWNIQAAGERVRVFTRRLRLTASA
jgi:hypothetical protein